MPKTPPSSPAAGVYAALATPRRDHSIEIDTGAFLEYLDPVAAAGVNGLVFFGATGEFIHFDLEARMHLTGLGVKRSRLPVLVNISHSAFPAARDLAEHAIDSGAQGLLVMPPYFYKYSDAQVEFFFNAMAGAVDGRLPLYLYNLPFCAPLLPLPLIERLLASGAFAGIKDSSGDWSSFETLQSWQQRLPFELLIGDEHIYAKGLQAGAAGVVSGMSAALPELIVALKRAHEGNQLESFHLLSACLDEFLSWVSQFPTPVVIREAADVRAWLLHSASVPLTYDARERLNAFRSWFATWLPPTLQLCATVR